MRQKWTCDILFFYGCCLLITMCISLGFRIIRNDTVVAGLMICMAVMVVYFFANSVYYFTWGLNLYAELPDDQKNKLPESVMVYTVFLLCYTSNFVCMLAMVYLFCYLGVMTWQMRGVLFAEDMN